MMIHSEQYAAKLCTFWSGVFGMDISATCSQLPAVPGRLYEQDHDKFDTTRARSHVVVIAASAVAVVMGLSMFALRRHQPRLSCQVHLDVEAYPMSAGLE